MGGTVFGLMGFGTGMALWLAWPLTLTVGVGNIIYDKYNKKN
jgi:hypothetical protein